MTTATNKKLVPRDFAEGIVSVLIHYQEFYQHIDEMKIADIIGKLDNFTNATALIVSQCEAYSKALEIESDKNEKQLEVTEDIINKIEDNLNCLRSELNDLNSNAKTKEEHLNRIIEYSQDLESNYENLKEEIQNQMKKLDELKKWFWVPFYGAYLAISNLVNNDIGKTDAAIKEIQIVNDELGKLNSEYHDLEKAKAEINNLLEEKRKAIFEYKKEQSSLYTQRKFYKKQIVNYVNAFTLFGEVITKMANIKNFITLNTTLLTIDGQLNEDGKLSLQEINDRLKKGSKELIEIGSKITCTNKGAFLQKFRVKWANGSTGWSDIYPIAKSRTFDLTQYTIPDGTDVWIEVSAVLGKTIESGDSVWFFRGASDEVTYRTKGTTFHYSVDFAY